MPRSLAAAASPVMAGALFAAGLEAWPFVICGGLKILYDLALLWTSSAFLTSAGLVMVSRRGVSMVI